MDWWSHVRLAITVFLDQHGLLAAFVFLLVEEAGVPVPVPGDVIMLVLGVRARDRQVSLWQAILALEVATVIGATMLYLVSRLAGRALVYRYGRYVRLDPDRLERAERWLRRHGPIAVFAGRLAPGMRIATAIICGVLLVPAWIFIPAMAIGALVYIAGYTLLGFFVGPTVLAFLEHVDLPLGALGSLVTLSVLLLWLVRARRALARRRAAAGSAASLAATAELDERLRTGAAAGALAILVATLLMDVLVHFAGSVFLAPSRVVSRIIAGRILLALALGNTPLLLIVAAGSSVVEGILWGAVYGGWIERPLRRVLAAAGLRAAPRSLATKGVDAAASTRAAERAGLSGAGALLPEPAAAAGARPAERLAPPAPGCSSAAGGSGSSTPAVAVAPPDTTLSDLACGVLFALAPLGLSYAVLVPIFRLGLLRGEIGPIALGAEAVRELVYGLVLGLAYPTLLVRRKSPATPRLFSGAPVGQRVAGVAGPAVKQYDLP